MRRFISIFFVTAFLVGCASDEASTPNSNPPIEIDFRECETATALNVTDNIPVTHIEIPYTEYFYLTASPVTSQCRDVLMHDLQLNESKLKTQQLTIFFDAVYPIQTVLIESSFDAITHTEVQVSLDGLRYVSIGSLAALNNSHESAVYASSVKLIFQTSEPILIDSISIPAADGYKITYDEAWSNTFLRSEGWTGADGIFSFNLEGPDSINHKDDKTAFIFSDTFIGGVNPDTFTRENASLINNSIGYYDPTEEFSQAFSYEYDSPALFLPDEFIYPRPTQLVSNEGLEPSTPLGVLDEDLTAYWLTDDLDSQLVFSFQHPVHIDSMHIWNFIDDAYHVKQMDVYYSNTQNTRVFLETYNLSSLSSERTVSDQFSINQTVTEIIIQVTDHESDNQYGLSKILFESDGVQVFPTVTGTYVETALNRKDESSRLWLQDGIRIADTLHVFPLLVKNEPGIFKVHQVGMISIPISETQLQLSEATTITSPLQAYTNDGGVIYYGAGVMDNRAIDGFIYVYGYKDLNGRHLVAARVNEEAFLDFNQWEYYDGQTFGPDIHKSAPLLSRVSAELSVSYLPTLNPAEPYAVFSMLDTTSGTVGFATGPTPMGPFSDWSEIYRAPEPNTFNNTFTYNAKLHLHLSTPDDLLVSYNVNSSDIAGLSNALIYYPRFIRMTKIPGVE